MRHGCRKIGPVLCVAAAICGVDSARAQSNQALIAGLQSQIAQGEQTLRNEPYLAAFCGQLRDGQHFFHRGRYRQGKTAVVALPAWENYLRNAVAAGTVTREVAQAQWRDALRRRDEVVNACTVDTLRAQLANARAAAQPPTGSAPAELVWNDTSDGNRVVGVKGTLTGNANTWQFSGTGTASWNGALRIPVQCTGSVSPGYPPKRGSKGTMRCHAQWQEQGKNIIWNCRGNGVIGASWSIGDWWFGMYAFPNSDLGCQGTLTAGDGKTRANMFGVLGIKSGLRID